MQMDFHYYGTYCAAILAGWSHEDSLKICYSAQFVDCCSKALLVKIRGPVSAATTQLQVELMDQHTDLPGMQDMTRIWASFHFLPYDLYAEVRKWAPAPYRNKYRLICGPNGELVKETVKLAKGESLQAAGVATVERHFYRFCRGCAGLFRVGLVSWGSTEPLSSVHNLDRGRIHSLACVEYPSQ